MKKWSPPAFRWLMVLGVFLAVSALLLILDLTLLKPYLRFANQYHRLALMDASLVSLIPLYIWSTIITRRRRLPAFTGGPRWLIWASVLLVFALALSLRVFLTLQNTLLREKIPVTYLVLLVVVVAEGFSLTSFGMTANKALRNVLLGVFLFVVFAMPTTPGLTALMTGSNPFHGFDLTYLALSLPFQLFGVALAEEALFRGYLQTKLETQIGAWGAVLLQAGLFGAWHFVRWVRPLRLEPMAFHVVTSLLFGVVLGAYYQHTRNLIAPIVLHALFNSVLASAGLSAWRLGTSGPMYLSLGGLAALVLAALVVAFAGRISRLFGVRPEM
ncbi:MAG: CPBP family intramembrane metalloprotease [Anaerolineales bacterium]|jgi:membrane protease YdiL (CAAX protease family)